MPKERNSNPVQAQRKADKAKAIKKGKSEAAARRNEKLGNRNPERIQSQINDLRQVTSSGGKLTKHEEAVLESLERDLKVVKKAREALGDAAPAFKSWGSRSDRDGGVLGKRRRDGDDASSSDEDVPDDVKNIPMPRDTPPPILKEMMDQWYAKRRARHANTASAATNANETPLGRRSGGHNRNTASDIEQSSRPPAAPVETIKTVYEAKPVIRNLQKEAVSAFMPTAVKMKMDRSKGQAGLMEPEEADRLEQEGYFKTSATKSSTELLQKGPHQATMEEVDDEG